MRAFPSCSGENGVQVADSSSSTATNRSAQNLVTCVYQCRLQGRSSWITISWTKNLMGQSLGVGIDDSTSQSLCKVDIKPWLFSKRRGCKNIELGSCSIDVHWDLSIAKFGSSPEPLEQYYVAVVFNHEMLLLLGDLRKEAYNKINSSTTPVPSSNAVFISKREHVLGKRFYGAKAQFRDKGLVHDIAIECDTIGLGGSDSCLVIHVDSKAVMKVTRLRWKFRGNQTIFVDGLLVEVFWDVYNWLFGNAVGGAIFMFQTCLPSEKLVANRSIYDPPIFSWSFLQNAKEEDPVQGPIFSLILYAWKNE